MASVKVAVRVRPFNRREKDLESQCVVRMRGNEVVLDQSNSSLSTSTPRGAHQFQHAFTFDFAYWSHNTTVDEFATQSKVYQDLGTDVVENAFGGYNVCVFAYGQTGSGKTYTMMGSEEEDRGLIPRICKALFDKMNASTAQQSGSTFRTEVSYLEIYNERVKDLLQRDPSHSLRIREHPTTGPYVQNLSRHLVVNYNDILNLMEKGNSIRTTAQTNMNDTSSRSHAIFTITFVNAGFSEGIPHETVSKIHLVDLAGSERADSTGATGQRLKEGAHINKSLVTLGSVISALAEATPGKNRSSTKHIPYRDSVLTWLLKDSLGGNSKTIMIATISPAEVNASETLSTLRYANRAKNIINKPTVNEDPNVKLIRDLRDEIDRLRRGMSLDPETLAVVQKELAAKEAQERTLTEEWTEKWKEAAIILKEQKALALKRTGLGVMLDSDQPHLVGIDEDVLSTGITLYHLKEGETFIGTSLTNPDIALKGACLEDNHCRIVLKNGVATLIPFEDALCMVNASLITSPVKLSQGCVVVLGKTNMFRYNDPKEAASMRKNNDFLNKQGEDLMNRSLLSQSLSDLRNTNRALTTVDGKHHLSEGNIKEIDYKQSVLELISETGVETFPQTSSNEIPDNEIMSAKSNFEFEPKESSSRDQEKLSPSFGANSTGDEVDELYKLICHQKEVIMTCLESDQCDIQNLNDEIVKLKNMQEEYTKLEVSSMKKLWRSVHFTGNRFSDDLFDSFDEKFDALVEQEVDRRLFQDRVLKSTESIARDKELERIKRDQQMLDLQRHHEKEIYLLRKRLHEFQQVNSESPPVTSSQTRLPANISIVQYQLKNGSHVEYKVVIWTPEETWTLERRFRMFRDLHVAMCHKYNALVQGLGFPSRRLFGNTSETVAAERQHQLESYLNALIQKCALQRECPLYNCFSGYRVAFVKFSPFFQPP
ncbi:hypothetical protein TCAL_06049 [Tigriopus californicus]|uniref:Kinesin-like protein n=1 Tax=Tigriopus californicus TaxID=6832 RepID=A0A553PQA6_TIGCA|nr:kinesin-like protein Klp98A [Tigriopus californicus]TRY79865.1 hypothetical protein TCAL_06049 [Tigriopus californicus]|eukprot:TCALIF_06049-PA protein Name:"Similar to KIF16B Kinesin-like protein KIF16B (Homo sapiens)" AED:0.02 eAED:0.02 QI:173/1/1/1/0.5/0.66/3/65/939